MAYGIEAVLPIEIGTPTQMVKYFYEFSNEEYLRANLDLLEVNKEEA